MLASLRVPRVALAALVGACLALAGAALQALLKNPLADPFLLGTSGGAAAGAACAALRRRSPLLSPAAAFVGAAAASVGVAALARRGGRLDLAAAAARGPDRQRVLLGAPARGLLDRLGRGCAHHALLDDGEPRRRDARQGRRRCSLRARRAAVLIVAAARLNLFAVGEENAAALGVDTERTKRVVFLAASLLTGAAVAFAGVIGFVGLLVPHAVRAVAGNDQRTLLPVSALSGAALLVVADALSRAALAPAELPIGAITAALGAPLFAWLLLRTP